MLHLDRKAMLVLGGVLLATLLLRLPSLFEPPWYDDEGIYAAVAQSMLAGSRLYTDVADSRPPGMYLIYALLLAVNSFDVFAVKLGATAAVLMTQVTVFYLAWKGWGLKTAGTAIAILGLVMSLPVVEGNLANAEVFMELPVALGMLLAVHRRYLWAGVAFGAAFLIKQITGVEFAACLVGLLLFAPDARRGIALAIAGFVAPVLAATVVLAAVGVLNDFLFVGFGYYFGYVQREARIPASTIVIKAALVAATVALTWWLSRGERSQQRFMRTLPALWTAFAIFGALFTSRPYPHYLLEAVPALALLAATVFVAGWNTPLPQFTTGRAAAIAGVSVVTCALFLSIYVPWVRWAAPDKMPGYYENFYLMMSGQRSIMAYNDAFDLRVNRNFVVLNLLRTLAKPGEKVLIWGEEPWLYALADLRAAVPYVVSYYAYEMPSGLQRVVSDIQTEKTGLVLWTKNKPLFPELKAELDKDYTVVSDIGNATLYQRLPVADARATTRLVP